MKRRAFTLIELLVVIAIIAILAAILFPVFAKAKNAAKQTQTVSNVKNIALGFQLYLPDYDDTYPLWSAAMGLTTTFNLEFMYPNLVNPYIKNGVNATTGELQGIWASPNSKTYLSNISNTYAYNHWTLGGFSSCARQVGFPLPAICTGRSQATYAEFADESYNFPANATSIASVAETIVIHDGAQLSRPEQYAIAFPTGDAQFIGVWGPHDLGRGPLSGPAGISTRTGAIARLQAGKKTVVGYADSHVKVVASSSLYHNLYSTPDWRGGLNDNKGWSRDWGY
ncbi:MAG TPA: hypothetical protein DCY02_03850 [Armatimonadetes bacterium]|nr:hypothetical protein [Armatimonadota bacterium]